jgi:hypothetical protein
MLRAHNTTELDFLMLRAYIKMSSFEGKNFPHPQHSKQITIFFYTKYQIYFGKCIPGRLKVYLDSIKFTFFFEVKNSHSFKL